MHRLGRFAGPDPRRGEGIAGRVEGSGRSPHRDEGYGGPITNYYYVMDKLKPLPKPKNSAYYYEPPMVDDIRGVLEENGCTCRLAPKVKRFCKEALKLKYKHCDIHGGNIMQNKRGALKFVDLESFTYDFDY